MIGNVQDRPLVSVVMSFHNGRDSLPWALRSLLWQTYDNWELILINDGSTDDSAEVVSDFRDSRIRVYGDSVCRGLPVRLNQGVSQARGAYIARMDADDIAFPERFSRQVEYLQAHPEVDLLAASALMVDADDRPIGVLATGVSHEEICRRPWHGFPMPHPTWMGRADWFRQNPYDERALKAQDQALLYRTYRTSCFSGLPDVLLGYRYASLSVRKTLSGRYYYLSAVAGQNKKHLLGGLASHSIAAMHDLAGMAMRLESRVIGAKVRPANTTQKISWGELLRRLKNGNLENAS